jgi:hypothetical protein
VQLPNLYPSFDDKVPIIGAPADTIIPALPTVKWNTTTTTVFTPGNNKMAQAMGVKMVADELLAATGAVAGATLGLTSNPGAVYLGFTSGEQSGRNLGSVMWQTVNFLMDDRALSDQFNRGQDPGEKGYQPQSWV